jgi:hypothetical protein
MDDHDTPLFETDDVALYEFLSERGHSFLKWRNDGARERFWLKDNHALRRHVREFESLNRGARNRAVSGDNETVVRTPEQLVAALIRD